MFSETQNSRKVIGDIDVIYHDGLYHLFHLVLPNHDFIAHAISTDAIHWRRIRNALFLGDPGSWDDLMLWTMHVSPDPHKPGSWRMFYTGLSRREQGNVQRVGLAVSDDLYVWKKYPVNWIDQRGPNDPELVKSACKSARRTGSNDIAAEQDGTSCFPLEADPKYYEASMDTSRGIVSSRDPSFVYDGDSKILLIAARSNDGPMVRRGCVGLYRETEPYHFDAEPPLVAPALYDDVEVPNLVVIEGQRYLIGSIREDAKIRYWHAKEICSEWESFHDNVLLPQGNYAGRISQDSKGLLLWCFFAMNEKDRTANNLLPPPKRLLRDDNGQLFLKTFEGFQEWHEDPVELLTPVALLKGRDSTHTTATERGWILESQTGYQTFLFGSTMQDFKLDCTLSIDGFGKCGFVFRMDQESHDAYFLSLDLLKGFAQIRAWGTAPGATGEHMMDFSTLQTGNWVTGKDCSARCSLLVFGSYIEFSINNRIILTLADQRFTRGRVGIYVESCELTAESISLIPLREPEQRSGQLVGT